MGVEIPQVPEEGGNNDFEIERCLKDLAASLFLFDLNHSCASSASTLAGEFFDVHFSPDDESDEAPSHRYQYS